MRAKVERARSKSAAMGFLHALECAVAVYSEPDRDVRTAALAMFDDGGFQGGAALLMSLARAAAHPGVARPSHALTPTL